MRFSTPIFRLLWPPLDKLGQTFGVVARRRTRFCKTCLKPVLLTGWLLGAGWPNGVAHTQTLPQAAPAPPLYQSSSGLDPAAPTGLVAGQPTFITGEQISGRTDRETVVQGQAQLRRGALVVKADTLSYDQTTDVARASGSVWVNRAGNVYQGPLLELELGQFKGFFEQPRYLFSANGAHGEAARVEFQDEDRVLVQQATYTTCRRLPGPNWLPDWLLQASSLELDNAEEVGTAKGVLLSFKQVPLLPIPYLSFPLSDKRKSGFLPPTPGVDNVNGFELSLPYYWNIAPNRDATITPTLMSKRGLSVNSDFRYLEANHSGRLQFNLMPSDLLRARSRWGYALAHQGLIHPGWGDGGVNLQLNLNRVSDDDYWRDFSGYLASPTQRLLADDLVLSWRNGALASSARVLKWQTLQSAADPITPPYDRLPQLNVAYARSRVAGFDYAVLADFTQFQADSPLVQADASGQVLYSAQRAVLNTELSYPWSLPGGHLTPKLKLNARSYAFASRFNGARFADVVVPTLSVDSGLIFERDTSYAGLPFTQTLEPRAFYVNTPYRLQKWLPNFDSAVTDFNFASIYSENAFVGNDRISDSHMLTLGVTSRWLNAKTGTEAARLSLAQRLRLRPQNVTLTGNQPAVTGDFSDVLIGGFAQGPRWRTDAAVQFNPSTQRSEQSVLSVSYQPSNYRTVSSTYRYQRAALEQVDVGWQWPINDLWGDRGQDLGPGRGQGEGRWYSVGRLNYSLKEAKMVSSIVGLEYDAGCWVSRVVLEHRQTSLSTANQSVMFQLEFVGFSRLGISPLKTLRDNVPNYQYLRSPMRSTNRFNHYD